MLWNMQLPFMKLLASLPFSHLGTSPQAKAAQEQPPAETTDRSGIQILTPEHLSEIEIQNEGVGKSVSKKQHKKLRMPSSELCYVAYVNLLAF